TQRTPGRAGVSLVKCPDGGAANCATATRTLTVRPNVEGHRQLRYALGMHELPTILTERIDDIPLLLEPRPRRGLPTVFDTHFPTHGTGTGLSLGWVSPLWLRAIVSRGAHRRGHVAP